MITFIKFCFYFYTIEIINSAWFCLRHHLYHSIPYPTSHVHMVYRALSLSVLFILYFTCHSYLHSCTHGAFVLQKIFTALAFCIQTVEFPLLYLLYYTVLHYNLSNLFSYASVKLFTQCIATVAYYMNDYASIMVLL